MGRGSLKLYYFLFWVGLIAMTGQQIYMLGIRTLSMDSSIVNSKNGPYTEEELSWLPNVSNTLTHVVIPFHESQISHMRSNVESWASYVPCPSSTANTKVYRPPDLYFHVSFSNKNETSKAQVEQAVRNALGVSMTSLVRSCFRNVHVVPMGLFQLDDAHVKGARVLFEELLHGRVIPGSNDTRTQYVLYMEPDMVPIQKNWLQRIQKEVEFTSEFWLMGSIFRGEAEHIFRGVDAIKYHINGNAIYNLRPDAFPKFYFDRVRPFVIAAHGDSQNAYDTDVYEFLHSPEHYRTNRHLMHYFRYTDLIQNLWQTRWLREDIAVSSPNTVLVHGGFHEPSFTVEETIKNIQKQYGVVLFQLLNEGYVEMTKSWICNVRRFKTVLPKTVFVTTDTAAYTALREYDSSLHVVLKPYSSPKDMSYGQYAYYDFMLFRTGFILDLLKDGVQLFLTESDATWFKDPTETVLGTPGDMVTMNDVKPPAKHVQGGFYLLRPTPATLQVWTKLLQNFQARMAQFKAGAQMADQGSEQIMMQQLLRDPSINVQVGWLDEKQFIPGLYYKDAGVQAVTRDPSVILNNWIIGNDAKIERAKEWGHWFLDSEGGCTDQIIPLKYK